MGPNAVAVVLCAQEVQPPKVKCLTTWWVPPVMSLLLGRGECSGPALGEWF